MSKVKMFNYSDLMSFLLWTITRMLILRSKNKYRVFLIENIFFLVHCPNVDLIARIATQLILSIVFSSLMSHFALMFEQF